MELQKPTSKTSAINNTILRAWRERWSPPQWGTHIKSVLPRGVSGDVYNLADCLLQQALVGSNANPLIMKFLKYSLCANNVSPAAVLKRISMYEHFDRTFCIKSLVEFLEETIHLIGCRSKPEELMIADSLVSILYWLFSILAIIVATFEKNKTLTENETNVLENVCKILEKMSKHQFTLGILYVCTFEFPETYGRIREKYDEVKATMEKITLSFPSNVAFEPHMEILSQIKVKCLHMPLIDLPGVDNILYCMQPMLAVEVMLNPCSDANFFLTSLQTVQQLKHLNPARLIYELLRSCFMSLSHVVDTTFDTMWGAFTFFKVPQMIKIMNAAKRDRPQLDFTPEVIDAFDMLIEDTMLLDGMDLKCSCNIIEYILNDWTKHHLVTEMHVKHYAEIREKVMRKNDSSQPSILNFIIRAEVPLSGILKTLSTDYNKVQEALLGVLSQVLVGNSFDLILSVATVEGRLRVFVHRLIQCNENSKQIPGEVGKPAVIRSTLFDVSFLMLTFIVQTYGAKAVLSGQGDSLFERWVRDCLTDRNSIKNPKSILELCDENIVDELIKSLKSPDTSQNCSVTWQDICINLPAVMQHVINAWEMDLLSSGDVKNILDNIKRRQCAFSVCATAYLCTYMYSVGEKELLKPLNMIQQFLTPTTNGEDTSAQDHAKERIALSIQIIRKMQNDVHPTQNFKSRHAYVPQVIVAQEPLVNEFKKAMEIVIEMGCLPMHGLQAFEAVYHVGGAAWFSELLIEEALKAKYSKDMLKLMDTIFGVFHFDIQKCTEAILDGIVLNIVNDREGADINEPQTFALARLCVYCILASVEKAKPQPVAPKKRPRARSRENDENDAKMRKIIADNTENAAIELLADTKQLSLTAASTSAAAAAASSSASSNTSNTDADQNLPTVPDSLQASLSTFFKGLQGMCSDNTFSPKVYFVFQFVALLLECGGDRVRPILKHLPTNLITNLLKVLKPGKIGVGHIDRIYDLRLNTGRQLAVADLCLWRTLNEAAQELIP